MAIPVATRTFNGVDKECIVIEGTAGTEVVILSESLMAIDDEWMALIDATTIDGVPSPTWKQKMQARTLPNGQKAYTFYSRVMYNTVALQTAATLAGLKRSLDVATAISALQTAVADLDDRVTVLEP